MRIVVDRVLCQGHGVCEGEAPELFSVSKKGDLTVLDDTPAEAMRKELEMAVKYCPTHALSIVDDDERLDDKHDEMHDDKQGGPDAGLPA